MEKFIMLLYMLEEEQNFKSHIVNSVDTDDELLMSFINKKQAEMAKNKINLTGFIIQEFVEFFKMNVEELKEYNKVFGNFKFLCEIMNSAKLKNKDKEMIIYTVIAKNNKIIENLGKFNIRFTMDKFLEIVEEESDLITFLKILENNTYSEIKGKREEELSEKEKKYSLILDRIETKAEEVLFDYVEKMRILYSCMFETKYDMDNISEIYNQLINLGVEKSLCEYMKSKAIKEMEKEQKNNGQKISPEIFKVKKSKTYISDKEYSILRKEIEKYYNIYSGTLINEDISNEKIIELAKKMNVLGLRESEITTFFNRSNYNEKLFEDNSIATFIETYNKLLYYSEKYNIGEEISTLKSVLEEMMICDDDSYVVWKEMFLEALSNIIDKFKYYNDYDYELSLIKNRE